MQTVTLDDGSAVDLEAMYCERPLALVFLRHIGCAFCREIVGRFREAKRENIVFVAMERAEEVAAFRERAQSPQRFISDPSRTLYEAFEMGRAGFGQIMNLKTLKRGFGAMRAGYFQGIPTADASALGGAFIIARDGMVVWEYRSADISDNPSIEAITGALRGASSPPLALS